MPATLDDIEQRLTALEQEVITLRSELAGRDAGGTSGSYLARLEAEARRQQPMVDAALNRVMKSLGISGPPLPVEEIRQLMLDEGIRPEENLFSRGIIEMREE